MLSYLLQFVEHGGVGLVLRAVSLLSYFGYMGVVCALVGVPVLLRLIVWRRPPSLLIVTVAAVLVCWLTFIFLVPYKERLVHHTNEHRRISNDWDRDCDHAQHESLVFAENCHNAENYLAYGEPEWLAAVDATHAVAERVWSMASYLFLGLVVVLVALGAATRAYRTQERLLYHAKRKTVD